MPMDPNPPKPRITGPAARESTKRAPRQSVVPDPDFVADLEIAEGEAAVRRKLRRREHGQSIKPPKGIE